MASNPTRVDGGIPILGRRPALVQILIEYNPMSGDCRVTGPVDPVAFYGILRLAEKAYDSSRLTPAAPPAPDNGGAQKP